MKRLVARLKALFQRSRLEREMNEEIESHFVLHVDENVHAGMSRDEAVRSARMKFGHLDTVKGSCREITGFPLLEGILQDFRYAMRGMRRSPGFTGVAVAILALGIGINAIVFTITDAVLFKGFPLVKENDRVVYLSSGRGCCASYADFEDWRAQAKSFEGMVAIHGIQISFSDSTGFPESFQVSEVGVGTFQLAGQDPFIGRDFLPADETPGAARVAILRYSFWERRYGRDPSIIGRTVSINGDATTIIGVMPKGFSFPQNSDLWVPLVPTPEARQNRGHAGLWFVFARLRPGATIESARAEMETIGRRLGEAYPLTNQGRNLIPQVQQFHEFFIGDNATRIYQAMLAAVVFVLLIACANVANLLLARGMGRSRETWMRIALGAGRWRIVRQLLVESLSLAAFGGFFGWWIAKLGVQLFALRANGPSLSDAIGGAWFNNTVDFSMDYRIFVYLVAVSMATGVLFGLVPAFRVTNLDVNITLKEAGRGSTDGPRAKRVSALLVASEMALALVLLTGAGVMVRSFLNIYNASLSFQPGNVVTALFALPVTKYATPEAQISFYNRLRSRLEAVPGVESVAIASQPPTASSPALPYELANAEPVSGSANEQRRPAVSRSVLGPGYFSTLGVAVLSGREFEETDRAEREAVVMVNQQFANTAWPNQNAVGKRLRFLSSNEEGWRTVIGVVPNLAFKDRTRQETLPMVYLPYLQEPRSEMWMVARTHVPPPGLTNVIRHEVQRIDPDLPPKLGPFSLADYLADSYLYRATTGAMFLAFAAIALLLASVGLYAVIAHSVGQRTQEIGIRMALGGTERDIRIMVLRHGLAPMGVGLALGVAGSIAVGQLLKAQLVGVSPIDPLTFAAAAAALILGGSLGCLMPAWHASRIDPMTALRRD
jgi:putative ABC transport system permease protein